MVRTKKKKCLPSSLTVTQSNKLVEARYNLPLSEQRLVMTMIASIRLEDEDFKEYRISVIDFADFLGIDRNSAHRELDKVTTSLMGRTLIFKEFDGPLKIGWVSSAKYVEKEGAVILCFDPKLKPYLLKLKGNFTSCKLEMLLSFKSQYSMRIYNWLKQYEQIRKREISVIDLREMLGLRNDQYVLYSNFKKDILVATQKELMKKADISFDFDELKSGRKVSTIHFNIINIIKNKQIKDVTAVDNSVDDVIIYPLLANKTMSPEFEQLIELVPEKYRVLRTVRHAIDVYQRKFGFDYVKNNVLYTNSKSNTSYAGLLNKSLKEDYGHDWYLQQIAEKEKPKVPDPWEREGFSNEKDWNDYWFKKRMESYGQKPDSNSIN